MANNLANTANLFLTAIFFHPLLPISIHIALLGFFMSYWIDKVIILNIDINIGSFIKKIKITRIDVWLDGEIHCKSCPLFRILMGIESSSFL